MENARPLVLSVSPRGQLTLPAELRTQLAIRPGDTVLAEIRDGGLFISAALVLPVEVYDAAREAEFANAASMSPDELAAAKQTWALK